MDPDVHLAAPGRCPRCGMTLVLKVPERTEYPLQMEVAPKVIESGTEAILTFRVMNSDGKPARSFELVHEKLMHLFLVSESLQFFAHLHPALQADGSFKLSARLPEPGMYRLLADYFPTGSVPQLALETLYVKGTPRPPHLIASGAPTHSLNLTASLRTDPPQPVAGLESRLLYGLDPVEGLEQYLGAWGHMLIASEDLVDLIHLHPFLAKEGTVQFNAIFPRSGNYKIWTQFQRKAVVNTVAFALSVTEL